MNQLVSEKNQSKPDNHRTYHQGFTPESEEPGSPKKTGIWKLSVSETEQGANFNSERHSTFSSTPLLPKSKFHEQQLIATGSQRKLGLSMTAVGSNIYTSTTDDETNASDQGEFMDHLFSPKLSYEDDELQSEHDSIKGRYDSTPHLLQNRNIPSQKEIEDTEESSSENDQAFQSSSKVNKQKSKNSQHIQFTHPEDKGKSQTADKAKSPNYFFQNDNFLNTSNSAESFQYNPQSVRSLTSPSTAQYSPLGWGYSSMPYVSSTGATSIPNNYSAMDLDSTSSFGLAVEKPSSSLMNKSASQVDSNKKHTDQYGFFQERLNSKSTKLPSSLPKSVIMPLWNEALFNFNQKTPNSTSPPPESRSTYTQTSLSPVSDPIPSPEAGFNSKNYKREVSNQQQRNTIKKNNEFYMNKNQNEPHSNNNQKSPASRGSAYSHIGSLMDLRLGVSRFYPQKERETTLTELNDLIILFDKYIRSLKPSTICYLEPCNESNTHQDLLPLFSNQAFSITWIVAQVNFNKRERAQFLEWKEYKNVPNYNFWGRQQGNGAYADRNHFVTTSGRHDSGRPGGGRESTSNLQAAGESKDTTDSKRLQVRALRMLYPKKDLGYEELKMWNREFYKSHGDLLNALVKVLEMFGDITDEDLTSDEESSYNDDQTYDNDYGYNTENGYTCQSNNNRNQRNKNKKKSTAATRKANKKKVKKINLKDENPLVYYSCFNGEVIVRKKDVKKIKDFYCNHMRTLCAQMKQQICIQFNEEMRRNLEISQKVFNIEF